MMISKKMAAALNEQVKNEFFAYWTYLQMSYTFNAMGLKVFSTWYNQQALEEQAHAMKIAHYLLDQGAKVQLLSLDQPKADYKSAEEVVQAALDHEIKVTKQINDLASLAREEHDHATENFLQFYVQEQVEEVATATELLDLVKMSDSTGQLLMLENRIMALRTSA
jgi:ferritin